MLTDFFANVSMPSDFFETMLRPTLIFVLFYYTIYMCKYYAVPYLLESIEESKRSLIRLEDRRSMLIRRQEKISLEIDIVERKFKLLGKEIHDWIRILERKQYASTQKQLRIKAVIKLKKQKQARMLARFEAEQKIIPEAVVHVRAELYKKFAKKKENVSLQNIIKTL